MPLHIVAWKGHLEVCKFLVSAGADVNAQSWYYYDTPGNTPLYIAAKWDHLEVCEYLVSVGADVKAESALGTPLNLANLAKNEEVMAYLREAGLR